MIDSMMLSPVVHRIVGETVVLVALIAMFLMWYLVFRKRPLTRAARGMAIAFQVALMVQVLLGIKLLDQGLGPMQLYIHYVGGLGPFLFFLLLYWFPSRDAIRETRWTALATTGAFAFALMAYTIGSMYVPGG